MRLYDLLSKAPFIRLFLPFLLGILTGIYFVSDNSDANLLLAICIVLFLASVYARKVYSYKFDWFYGVLSSVLLFFFGLLIVSSNFQLNDDNHFSKKATTSSLLQVRLIKPIVEKNSYSQTLVEVEAVSNHGKTIPTKGKLLLYLKNSNKVKTISYGSVLAIRSSFEDIPVSTNPNQFDYKRYLSNKNIHHQSFIHNDEWVSNELNRGSKIVLWALQVRSLMHAVFEKYGLSASNLGVASALIFGNKDYLTHELKEQYANAGVIHVLAVSGLHVGILYVAFMWMFGFMDKLKYGNIFKAICVLLLLWFYAVITGLSPSVLRATIMFSIILFGKTYNKQSNIINSIVASAFFMLLYNPLLIMDVGFQLSYLAVVGIVLLYDKFFLLIPINSRMLKSLWALMSVSIAAQIATSPLVLFYFHQFPTYFLFANMLVIPLVTISVYVGVVLMVVSPITWFSNIIAKLFNILLDLLNGIVSKISTLPYSTISNIWLNQWDVTLLYFIIIFALYYFFKPKIRYLFIALIGIACLLVMNVVEQYSLGAQRKIIVYNIKGKSAINIIAGKSNYLLANSNNKYEVNANDIKYNIAENWMSLGLGQAKVLPKDTLTWYMSKNGAYIKFENKVIARFQGERPFSSNCHNPMVVDLLILSHNTKITIHELLKCYNPKCIIFDSSNQSYRIKAWVQECKTLNVKYHSVLTDGAFTE